VSKPKEQRSIFECISELVGSSDASEAWELRVDGASRGNPGHSGAGVYLKKGTQDVVKKGFYLGTRTNNEAEYLALVVGVYFLKKEIQKGERVTIISDSQLLICQLNGSYRVRKPELQLLHATVRGELEGIACTFKHVERALNSVADALANQGVDEKITLPLKVLDVLKRYEIYL